MKKHFKLVFLLAGIFINQKVMGCDCGSITSQIISNEVNGHLENLEIKFYLKRSDDLHIKSISYYLPDSFSVDSNSLDTGYYSGSDSSIYSLYLKKNSYNKNHLLKELKIYISTESQVKRITGYFYWTPWNTTKIYSLSNIPKRDLIWMPDDPSKNELVSFPLDSLPNQPDTNLPIVYREISGLPYMVPVNDTTDTSTTFSYKKGPNDFEGTLEGKLVFPMKNEEKEDIKLPIANILMELRIGATYKKRFTTDDSGSFTVTYDYAAAPGWPSVNIRIFAISQDEVWEDDNGHPGEKVIVADDLSLNFFSNRKNSAIHKSLVKSINVTSNNYYKDFENVKAPELGYHHVYHWARRVWDFAEENGYSPNKILIKVPDVFPSSRDGDCSYGTNLYNGVEQVGWIDIKSEDCINRESVIYHELAHWLVFNLTGYFTPGLSELPDEFKWPNTPPSLIHHWQYNMAYPAFGVIEGFAEGLSYIFDSRYYLDDNEAKFNGWGEEYHRLNTSLNNDVHPMTNGMLFASAVFDLWDSKFKNYGNTEIANEIFDDESVLHGEKCSVELSELLFPFTLYQTNKISDVSEYFNILSSHVACSDRQKVLDVVNVNLLNINNSTVSHFVSSDNICFSNNVTHQNDDVQVLSTSPIVVSKGNPKNYSHNYEHYDINEISTTNNSFNYTINNNSTDYIIDPLEIIDNGTLYINSNLPKGLQTNTTGNPTNGTHNNMDVCGAKLSLSSGGSIVVGTSNHSTAQVSVNDNAFINLDYENGSASNLLINDGSKLTITENGELRIGTGANITLNGSNAILEISGKVVLAENAKLTFSGSGKVIFNSPIPDNIIFAVGSSIELIGSGNTDVVAEIHQSSQYWFMTGNDANSNPRPDYSHIKIKDGKILLADDSRLCIDGPVELDNVVFDTLNCSAPAIAIDTNTQTPRIKNI